MPSESDAEPSHKKLKVSNTLATGRPSSFFLKASQKPKSDLSWKIVDDTLLTAKYRLQDILPNLTKSPSDSGATVKIAAFDLDGTLIKTKSGTRFPRDEADWIFFDNRVPTKIRELSESGHLVVIFTNQAGLKLSDSAKRFSQFKLKVDAITSTIKVPLLLYAASAHDVYRKPRLGMFTQCLHDLTALSTDTALAIDREHSFFVGDAAGRPTGLSNDKRDFSASDRKLALNAQIHFHTPEEFFLKQAVRPFDLTGFDPIHFKNPEKADHLFLRSSPQEIILFVGSPASGKSTYYRTFLEPLGYVRINQDTLKTRQRCLSRAKEELLRGHSVCIDNTNASIEARAHWLALAADIVPGNSLPVRAIHFTAEVEMCEHNNAVRAFAPRDGEETRELLPAVAFSSFRGRYELPKVAEGLARIDQVQFILKGTEQEQKIWRQYWT